MQHIKSAMEPTASAICDHTLPLAQKTEGPGVKQPSRQQGFTLIEILVAVVVLVVGVLGVVALEVTSKRGTFDALQRSTATSLAEDILERMRANPVAVRSNSYNATLGAGAVAAPATDCLGVNANCNPAQLASFDLYQFEQRLLGEDADADGAAVGGLVEPTVCVNHTTGMVTVVVVWRGQISLSDPADGAETFIADCGARSDYRRQFVVRSFIDN